LPPFKKISGHFKLKTNIQIGKYSRMPLEEGLASIPIRNHIDREWKNIIYLPFQTMIEVLVQQTKELVQ
jgi:hypothetical protein